MHKNQIISQLIQKKIITISPDKPFTYASGMLSPIYTDLRLTVSYPELRDMIASDLANLIAKKFPETTIIGCLLYTSQSPRDAHESRFT